MIQAGDRVALVDDDYFLGEVLALTSDRRYAFIEVDSIGSMFGGFRDRKGRLTKIKLPVESLIKVEEAE